MKKFIGILVLCQFFSNIVFAGEKILKVKAIILHSFASVPMPTIWFVILYFLVKSNFWKKFFLHLGIIFLLLSSLPVVSTYIGKFFYNDYYRISNHHKKPAYVLIPTAGIWYDGYEKFHPTYDSITRTQYGKKLSDQFSIPMILSGGGINKIKEASLISKFFDYDFYLIETESRNTFEMAKNLKKFIKISDGPLLLATKPMHNRRTILALKKQNFDVLIPDTYLQNKKISYSVIPSFRGITDFNEIIYETLGIIWYYVSGKI